ncbi:MAG: hypothetical protein GX847_07600, partial [Clostridiales bacterium]|nr:hypothetical protein [Clostridiales bacterium]
MKISLELIAQEMAGMIPEARVTISPGESSSEMTLFNFMLLGTEALSKEILVLIGPNKIFEPDGDLLREIRDTGASLCFVGTPPCAVTEGQTPYIRCVYHDKTAPD